ncbi:MAG: hypothetical protein A2Y90_02695 [Chloroflexi bacterium RBG_13_52_12]|nr:MAG: hypothetical protein A2Y90_02695 [Chloroflexi bacterium RBG_13_52_12]
MQSKAIGRSQTGLIKHILLHSFWSFLLTLSGIVDIAVGVLFLVGVFSVKNGSPMMLFLICLIIGLVYFSGGVSIAIVQRKKMAGKQTPAPDV